MKKLLVIAIIAAAAAASCRSPVMMYDPDTGDHVTSKVYYERHPEEDPQAETVTLTITLE